MSARWRRGFLAIAVSIPGACSDPAPPEPEVASIELSVPVSGTSLRFRDSLIVRATPQAALGVPLEREVRWTSITPALLSVQPLTADGDSARIRAVGVGTGQIRVSAGTLVQTFDVMVQDTVFAVTLTPGALSLVAGDTVSYSAAVSGPPNADRAVRWDVTNAAVLQTLTSPDPMVLRVQVRVAGSASVRATALADTTRSGSSAVAAQVGKLAFVVQPSAAPREIPFSPAPRVEIWDATGNRSTRAANDITLSASGACGASVIGASMVQASGGVANFPSVALSARCPSLTLQASANPPASAATSQPFAIAERGCDAVRQFTTTDTITATIENVDCVVTRGGTQYFAHMYSITVPNTVPGVGFRLHTTAAAFSARVESYVWSDDPIAFSVDSLTAPGTLSTTYWLAPGAHRMVVMARAPDGTGSYSRITVSRLTDAAPGQPWADCLIVTSLGASFSSTLTGGDCDRPFRSRPGASPGRLFLLYLRSGKALQVAQRPFGTALDNDAYLEAFDVTSTFTVPPLIGVDDNSGGGVNGTDALLTIQPAPTGRFILIRAARVGGAGTSTFTITISP
jgi:hypothetical protein